jgi:hypothetical protein
MHEGTPAILRMLQTLPRQTTAGGTEEGKTEGSAVEGEGRAVVEGVRGNEPIYLFLREPGCYYTFCGRVVAAAWAPGSRPLRLDWELTCFGKLLSSQSFRGLLGPVLRQEEAR